MTENKIQSLSDYLDVIQSLYGERDAYKFIVDGEVISKTYSQLKNDANALSSWLVNNNWKRKHVAILGGTSYEWVVSFLGVINSGNVAIPIDKMLPDNEILNLLEMGDVDVVFLSDEFSRLTEDIENADNKVEKVIDLSSKAFQDILRTDLVSLPKVDANEMAEILFTSGTTGVSKGVMLSQKNIVNNIEEVARMDFTQNIKGIPVVMSVLPIHHTFELTIDNLGVLRCGATVCINDKLENIVSNINMFKPACILVVPAIAEVFYRKVKEATQSGANKKKIALGKKINRTLQKLNIDARRKIFKSILSRFGGNLTNIVVGGAALRAEIVEEFAEFGINMYQGYGLTECAPLVSANYPGHNRTGSVGLPVSYMDVKVENGEILVKGDGVMLGYYKNPEATAEVISKDGWFSTGDLGHQDDDGYIYITGRSKNIIILDNGKNIYPEELEEYIKEVPGVKDVMVYENKGKICAIVQPNANNDSKLIKEIQRGIRKINEGLPAYKKVVGIDFRLKDFPKTTTMKIKRREVMEWIKEKNEKNKVEYCPPKNEKQKTLVEAFEKVLDKQNVGIRDDFFELGGDSLLAMELALTIGVQAQDIYENPTVELLEQAILNGEREDRDENAVDVNAMIARNQNMDYFVKPKYVLITGATGFLGAHILKELLGKKLNVICLVRDEKKLEPTLKEYFPKEYRFFNYKIAHGDIEKEKFGMTDQAYDELANAVDMVIHTAANVHHAGHYEDFERTNVMGTQHVIDFCFKAGAVLQHTSTASVNGAGTVGQSNPDAMFDEFHLDIGQKYKQNVYIHSKFKAEERVLIAREKGLKANIYRIGNLTWRMSDGKFQKNAQDNGFLDRVRGMFKVGMYSSEIAEYPIDFTAVDECADALVRLSLHNRVNNIYNLYNPNVLYIHNLCKKMLLTLKQVPKEVFERKLKEKIEDKEVAVLSFYTTIASASKNIPISNEFTVAELKKVGFKWSKISFKYLKYIKNL